MTAFSSGAPAWRALSALALAVVASALDWGAHAMPSHPPAAAVDTGTAAYRGSDLDPSALARRPNAASLRQAAEHQVDLVEAASLDRPTTRSFLSGLTVMVRPGGGEGGHDSGGRNRAILTLHGRARIGALHPAGAYVLKNEKAFFATTAGVYLHARLAREPFTRDELHGRQSFDVDHLPRLVGPVRG